MNTAVELTLSNLHLSGFFYRQGGDVASTTTYVDYRTEDGTANAGSDFEFTTGTLIFQPGETERHIEIRIIDDDVFEEDEHFFVNLSNARNEGDDETTSGDSQKGTTEPTPGQTPYLRNSLLRQ